MCLDLKHPRSKEVTKKLIKWADVVVDNWRPGVMEKLGLGYEALRSINPSIIMVSSTQQGSTGPFREVAALGPTPRRPGWPSGPCRMAGQVAHFSKRIS